MAASWNTKWGPRRVRQDPPTVAEALAAAQCLTEDPAQQAEIAAELMGVDVATVQGEQRKLASRRAPVTLVAASRERGMTRTVVIERKASRRLQGKPAAMAGRPQPRPQPGR